MTETIERPASFGPEGTLFGMLSQAASEPPTGIGCLVLNTGANHRIGPHRINVKIARRLAGAGVPTLRFDLSGIGDSPAAQTTHSFRTQAVADMKAAMDYMEASLGVRRFLVFGICSGAENGLAIALADPRVVGLMTLDGAIYLTRAARIERKLRRWAAFPVNGAVRRSYAWWSDFARAASGDAEGRANTLQRLRSRFVPGAKPAASTNIFEADTPWVSAEEHGHKLSTLLDRGVSLCMLYSATYNSSDRNRGMLGQLAGAPYLERIDYRYMNDVDHTATTLEMQGKLLGAIETWATSVGSRSPGQPAASAPQSRGMPEPSRACFEAVST